MPGTAAPSLTAISRQRAEENGEKSPARIALPRQTNWLRQPLIQSTGNIRSRSIQASGESGERCQRAAWASAASAPYQSCGHRADDRNIRARGEQPAGEQRQRRAGEQLGKVARRKARAAQPRPAHLPVPHFGRATMSERLSERRIDQADAQALRIDELGRGRILGEIERERLDAARLLQHLAAPQHRLALGEAGADRIGEILPARLIGVEECAFELGPEAARPAPDRRGADDAGVAAPRGDQALDVVGRHQHIGIRDDDPPMPRRAPAFHHVVEFRIWADAVVADQQARAPREIRDQPLDQRHHRIARRGHAEQDLVARMIEPERRAQRFLDIVVDPAHRSHHADTRRSRCGDDAPGGPAAACRDRRCSPRAAGPHRRNTRQPARSACSSRRYRRPAVTRV